MQDLAVVESSETGESGHREELRAIIQERSVLSGGEFTLASGKTSSLFFDMKKTMLDPDGCNLACDEILDILDAEDHVDFIGGLIVGSVPIISQVVMKSRDRRPVRGFWVRKEPKDHGTRQLIDGYIDEGAKVILFDDVTTTGGSVLSAVGAVRKLGCQVVKVITLVDRLERAQENLAKEGVPLHAIFTRDDFHEQ